MLEIIYCAIINMASTSKEEFYTKEELEEIKYPKLLELDKKYSFRTSNKTKSTKKNQTTHFLVPVVPGTVSVVFPAISSGLSLFFIFIFLFFVKSFLFPYIFRMQKRVQE